MSPQARTQREALDALALALLEASRAAAALAAGWPVESPASGLAPGLFSVAALAEHLGISRSAAREWCAAGRFAGAFRLNRSGQWRIPAEAVAAFVAEQAAESPHALGRGATIRHVPNTRPGQRRARPGGGGDVDLGAWRRVRRPEA